MPLRLRWLSTLALLAVTLIFGSSRLAAATEPTPKNWDAAVFADGGSSDSHSTFTGEAAVAFRVRPSLTLQASGTGSTTSSLRQIGYSAGLGHEPGRWGVFVFADGLSYRLDPYEQTSHVQIRPVVRYVMDRFSGTAFYAVNLTGRRLIAEVQTIDSLAEDATGVFRTQGGFRLYNTALNHGGAEISAIPAPWAVLTARGRLAEGGTFDLSAGGEARAWKRLIATLRATRTKVAGGQRVEQSYSSLAVGLGWRFGAGRADYASLRRRLLVSPDYPLVVQEREDWTKRDRVASALGLAAQCVPTSGRVALMVNCSANVTGGQGPFQYAWTFGDGTPGSSAASPNHTYTTVGTMVWTLTVTDALNLSRSVSGTVIVDSPSLSVACNLTPTSGVRPLPVSGSCSASGGTGAFTYRWTWGDGTTSWGASSPHTYPAAGVYLVRALVASGGDSRPFDWEVTVTDPVRHDPTLVCTASPNPVVTPGVSTVTCVYVSPDDGVGSWVASLSENPFASGTLSATAGSGVGSGAPFTFNYITSDKCVGTITVVVNDNRGGSASAAVVVPVI